MSGLATGRPKPWLCTYAILDVWHGEYRSILSRPSTSQWTSHLDIAQESC
jgi:hypothetical protein